MRSLTVLIVAATVVLFIVGLGLGAIYVGMQDRANAIEQEAALHYSKGIVHLEEQDYELAIAELELVLQLAPGDPDAMTALAQAQESLDMKPSPTPVLRQEINVAYYAELEQAYAEEDWAEVFRLTDLLWTVDPDYRRAEVEAMLFDAFGSSGLALVEEGRIEEAIRYFDRALALQPDAEEVWESRKLASLYMDGLSYWDADWAKALEDLGALYELAPDYLDVRERVHDAAINYGDLFAKQGDWCVAVAQYERALDVIESTEVASKLAQAERQCRLQPTATAEGTATPVDTRVPSGTFVGRLVEQTEIDSDKIFVRGRVVDQDGQGVWGVAIEIKAWDWSVTHVSDGNGYFSFDGLDQPVVYTLALIDHESMAVDAPTEWGKITWIMFEEQ